MPGLFSATFGKLSCERRSFANYPNGALPISFRQMLKDSPTRSDEVPALVGFYFSFATFLDTLHLHNTPWSVRKAVMACGVHSFPVIPGTGGNTHIRM